MGAPVIWACEYPLACMGVALVSILIVISCSLHGLEPRPNHCPDVQARAVTLRPRARWAHCFRVCQSVCCCICYQVRPFVTNDCPRVLGGIHGCSMRRGSGRQWVLPFRLLTKHMLPERPRLPRRINIHPVRQKQNAEVVPKGADSMGARREAKGETHVPHPLPPDSDEWAFYKRCCAGEAERALAEGVGYGTQAAKEHRMRDRQ